MIDRRLLLSSAAAIAAFAGFGKLTKASAAADGKFEVEKTPEEWKRQLTPEQYRVLREHGTERPYSSPLNHEKRKGMFACVGCDLPLYSSETKYDSGTGWPSFFDHLPDAIGKTEDRSYFMIRTEVHCRRCGGHLGHVFNDGPRPTGLRYCMDGVAMTFKPAEGANAPS